METHAPHEIFVALGSNLPSAAGQSPQDLVREAATALMARAGGGVLSPLFVTEPVDCPEGSAPFVNAVVGLPRREGESANSLHSALIDLEAKAGRLPVGERPKNAPRPLDLDLLAFGALVQANPTLTIPHPRCHLRRFVLEPWAAIAPDFLIPGRGTVEEILLRI